MKKFSPLPRLNPVLFLLLTALCTFVMPLSAQPSGELVIVNTADLHGMAGENSPLARQIIREREKHSPTFLYLDCGDTFIGTPEASRSGGANMLPFLKSTRCDAAVPGNHDFEFGLSRLAGLVRMMAENGTVMLGGNIGGSILRLPAYKIFQAGDWQVAVIGLGENLVDRRIVCGKTELFLHSDEATLRSVLAQIRKSGRKIDLTVLIRHGGQYGGRGNFSETLRKFPEIDLVLGGHTHKVVPGEKFAGSFYAQAGCHGRGFIKIRVRRSRNGQNIFLSEYNGHEVPAPGKIIKRPSRVNDRFARQVTEAMRSYTRSDAAFFISDVMPEEEISAPLPPEKLYRLFRHEDPVATIMITPDEYRTLTGIFLARQKKYNSVIGYTEKLPEGKSLIKATFSGYFLAGAGNAAPEAAKLLAEHAETAENTATPLREVFNAYLSGK